MKKILLFMVVALLVFGLVSCDQEVKTKTYKVTYNANGAVGNAPATIEVEEGGTATVPSCDSLSMKGYDFVGWNTKKDGNGRAYKESQTLKVTSDIVLYAQWSVHEYSVSYKFDGGWYPEGRSNPNTYTIETETFTLNSPEKDGYEFLGWKTSEGEEPNKNVSIGKGTTGDLSFTAVWRLAFSIRYDANGGEGYVDRTYKQKGESVEVSQASGISREGYEFVCWNISMGGSGMDYKPGDLYSEDADVRLYAKWTAVKYTISYDLDGGILPEGKSNPSEYTIESAFALVNPEREGYVFVGWKVAGSSDETAEENLSIKKGAFGNKSFTAVWRSASKCTVTFDANGADGGTAPSQLTVYEGDSFSVPSCGSLYKDGCAFYGWNTNSNGTGTTYTGKEFIKANGDIVLYAVWKESPLKFFYSYELDSYSVKCMDKSVSAIVIPSEYGGKPVTSLEDYAFSYCESLREITIPSSVTSIGDSAFYNCSDLTEITIPSGVTRIGNYAFSDCSGLTSITIPSSVEIVGGDAFRGCSGLTSVGILEGVTKIIGNAFYGCVGLTKVSIPSSVTTIGEGVFSNCEAIESIEVVKDNSVYYSEGNCIIEKETKGLVAGCKNSVIPVDVKEIRSYAFYGCSYLTSVKIPSSVTSIGNSAFNYCKGLTELTISEGVTSIGNSAFNYCKGLTELTIPESMTRIGKEAFSGCSGLTGELTIPEGVANIGAYTFAYCSGLTGVTIPSSVTSIGSYAFSGCSGLTGELSIPETVTEIGAGAFKGCRGLTSIAIPEGVKGIGYETFLNCNSLSSIAMPSSVTEIGNSAFDGCSSLTSITIPEGVMKIGIGAFRGCRRLASIKIPSNVTSIGYTAFNGCSSLTSITIPEGVTKIEIGTFSDCSSLTSVKIPSSVTTIENYAFSGCTRLSDIDYSGTIVQWNSIPKIWSWDYNADNYTIHCTDGDIAKN